MDPHFDKHIQASTKSRNMVSGKITYRNDTVAFLLLELEKNIFKKKILKFPLLGSLIGILHGGSFSYELICISFAYGSSLSSLVQFGSAVLVNKINM
jgi:hypothetical protein